MNIFKTLGVSIALLAAFASASHAASPAHLYEFNNSFADTLGGPSMAAFGGTLGAGTFTFDANEGLAVAGAAGADVYTIDTTFTFSSTSGYRRIVDFKDGASDGGLYNLGSALNFYPLVTGSGSVFSENQPVRVTITRDGSDTFAGYVNGVLQFSFSDPDKTASFSAAGQVARFFIDDSAVGGEASAGSVDYIAFYNTALSAGEVAALAAPVPEPATYAMMLAGLVVMAGVARRRRRA